MPKIPTFTARGQITTQGPGVVSNIQVSPSQNIGAALRPVTNFLEKEYIKERTLEENNKVDKLISDTYNDNKDGPNGLSTIVSETGKNGNPSEADLYFNNETDKLYKFFEASKTKNLSRFGKQIFKSKFYASAAELKSNALLESRKTQFKNTSDIDTDFITKKTLNLSKLQDGAGLQQIFKSIDSRLDNNPYYNERPNLKAKVKKDYQQFGAIAVANNLLVTNPALLKKQLETGVFDVLEQKNILEFAQKADEAIKDEKFKILSGNINRVGVDENLPPSTLSKLVDSLSKGDFRGNKNLQNIYNKFSTQEKREFARYVFKKGREKRNELLFEVQSAEASRKLQTNELYDEVMEDVNPQYGIDQKRINNAFEKDPPGLDQFSDLNNKIQIKQSKKETVISDADLNRNIIGMIVTDKINSITDKFTLTGETEALSIVERFDKGNDVDDIRFYANILKQQNTNPVVFKRQFEAFYSFLENTRNLIASDSIKFIDSTTYNKTLTTFKRDMYDRFQKGLSQGLKPVELIDPTSKNFIAKDFISYTVDKNEVFKSMMKDIKKKNNVPKRLPNESFKDYKKRTNQ